MTKHATILTTQTTSIMIGGQVEEAAVLHGLESSMKNIRAAEENARAAWSDRLLPDYAVSATSIGENLNISGGKVWMWPRDTFSLPLEIDQQSGRTNSPATYQSERNQKFTRLGKIEMIDDTPVLFQAPGAWSWNHRLSMARELAAMSFVTVTESRTPTEISFHALLNGSLPQTWPRTPTYQYKIGNQNLTLERGPLDYWLRILDLPAGTRGAAPDEVTATCRAITQNDIHNLLRGNPANREVA